MIPKTLFLAMPETVVIQGIPLCDYLNSEKDDKPRDLGVYSRFSNRKSRTVGENLSYEAMNSQSCIWIHRVEHEILPVPGTRGMSCRHIWVTKKKWCIFQFSRSLIKAE